MKKCIRFVGLDDSKNSIDVAVASVGFGPDPFGPVWPRPRLIFCENLLV